MEYRNLGRSGLMVSSVGLGCDNFGHKCDPAQSAAIVHKAMDLGVTLFDTSDIYGPGGLSEEYLGRALKGRRQDAVVATKFVGPTGSFVGMLNMGTSRRHIMNAVEASLKRLDMDHIDLYQIHFPFPGVPMQETLRALDDLIRHGKVRYIGSSNFSAWQLVDANWIARSEHLTPFISAQNAYNLLDRQLERDLVPACNEHGVGILPYFPLASGFLTGKYRSGQAMPDGGRLSSGQPTTEFLTGVPDAVVREINAEMLRWVTPQSIFTAQNYELLGKLEGFAKAHGHTIIDLAVSWLACQRGVSSVLVGASRPEQVEQTAQSSDWKLTAEELAEVNAITECTLSLPPVPKILE